MKKLKIVIDKSKVICYYCIVKRYFDKTHTKQVNTKAHKKEKGEHYDKKRKRSLQGVRNNR